MDISVIICTRNRHDSLSMALRSLEGLAVPAGLKWEAVIVDNGSTDQTADICRGFARKDPQKYIYVHEPRRGKSIGLNTAIQVSRGKLLAFIDDDCIVDRSWLQEILKEYDSDPQLAVLGGRVELYDNRDNPATTLTYPEKMVLAPPLVLFKNFLIIGCNMVVRKDVFDSVGGFDTALGPGTPAIAEDVDFIYRANKKGFRVAYVPSVLVYHNHGRRTDEEIAVLMSKYCVGRGAFYCKHILECDRHAFIMACQCIYGTIKKLIKTFGDEKQDIYHRLVIPYGFVGYWYYLSSKVKTRSSIN